MKPATLSDLAKRLLLTLLTLTCLSVGAVDLNELYPDTEAEEAALDVINSETSLLEEMESENSLLDDIQVDDPFEEGQDTIEDELTDESAAISSLLDNNDSGALVKDVVVVLDNSGSMKKNDPDFLAREAVSEFISGLDSQTRIAIVIFDQDVRLAVPLTNLTEDARAKVLTALDGVNYKGLFTDSPAGVERAIYELKNNGREGVQQSIVFMTDGIVDTGKPEIDLEKGKWLKEDLAADAADEGIKVFGVAFTEAADFQLIQSIAQQTDGEYYRALQAADLQKVFRQINVIINEPPKQEQSQSEQSLPQPVAQPAPVQQPVIIEVPTPAAPSMSNEERVRSTIMIVAASILFITLLAIVYLLLRRSREVNDNAGAVVADAFINDVQGYTSASQYQLGQKPTMFGRVAGKDTEHLNYLVIPESTIGRRHALIEYKDYGFWISDQGSINGTFVNDKIINSEVCLKHGDKVRLHKFEFDFVMPEMDDAGMTVISNTTFAAPTDNADEATQLSGAAEEPPANTSIDEPEFDITGGVGSDFEINMDVDDDGEEETLIRGNESELDELGNTTDPGVEDESEDETLIPEVGELVGSNIDGDTTVDDSSDDDETLMRGDFIADEDDDVTIRKDADDAIDDFFDIGDDNEKNT